MVIRNGISTYIFLSEKSTVVQTGGIAGVHRTYSIKGRFDLSVDSDAGTASFLRVDANLINSFLQARSLGELFNMTALSGVIIDKSTISCGRFACRPVAILHADYHLENALNRGSKIMNIFEYAMQMEKDGEDYYRQLAQQTVNKGMRTILAMLADEEVKHYNVLEKMKTEKPQIAETRILTDAKNIFVQIKESGESFDFDIKQTELYKKAQDIEKKSHEFYTENANEVTEEYQKELFLKLADEERKHYLLLDNIIEFVSRPEHWLENAEFYHLDEY